MKTEIVPVHSQRLITEPVLALFEAAAAAARAAAREKRRRRAAVSRRGWQLQPGADTPLWNQLMCEVRACLRVRGSQAQLARVLGLPRQRLNRCLTAQAAMLDAERALLLLGWLAARRRGRELAVPPQGVK